VDTVDVETPCDPAVYAPQDFAATAEEVTAAARRADIEGSSITD
jgi:hypothetical protein